MGITCMNILNIYKYKNTMSIYIYLYTLFLFLGENFLHQASDPSSFGVLLLVFIDLLQMLDRLLSLTAQK